MCIKKSWTCNMSNTVLDTILGQFWSIGTLEEASDLLMKCGTNNNLYAMIGHRNSQ
jgi:hypothetical protein